MLWGDATKALMDRVDIVRDLDQRRLAASRYWERLQVYTRAEDWFEQTASPQLHRFYLVFCRPTERRIDPDMVNTNGWWVSLPLCSGTDPHFTCAGEAVRLIPRTSGDDACVDERERSSDKGMRQSPQPLLVRHAWLCCVLLVPERWLGSAGRTTASEHVRLPVFPIRLIDPRPNHLARGSLPRFPEMPP